MALTTCPLDVLFPAPCRHPRAGLNAVGCSQDRTWAPWEEPGPADYEMNALSHACALGRGGLGDLPSLLFPSSLTMHLGIRKP